MKVFAVRGAAALAATALCLCATLAGAQSAASPQAPASSPNATPAPLQLQVPAQPLRDAPAASSDNAVVDAIDSGADQPRRAPEVHGSFTTGVGYSKGSGTSTMNAADLDISGQTDSGRSYDMQIHAMRSKGPGFDPYGGYYGYGPRFRGY
ncbi:MAG TPA: hypothetical protein VGC30_13025 [Dokdonella sp.]